MHGVLSARKGAEGRRTKITEPQGSSVFSEDFFIISAVPLLQAHISSPSPAFLLERNRKPQDLQGNLTEAQVLLWRLGLYFHSPSADLEPLIKADSMHTIKFRAVEVKRTGSLTD